jgi:hypothetical protein
MVVNTSFPVPNFATGTKPEVPDFTTGGLAFVSETFASSAFKPAASLRLDIVAGAGFWWRAPRLRAMTRVDGTVYNVNKERPRLKDDRVSETHRGAIAAILKHHTAKSTQVPSNKKQTQICT